MTTKTTPLNLRFSAPCLRLCALAIGLIYLSNIATAPRVMAANESIGGAAAAVTVGRWDRFEIAVGNTKRYVDPYKDVTLNVTYTRPDKGTINFWGFYDSGEVWRMRFMPDQLGGWSYRATFSDGSPGTSGTFTCVPSTIPGMISRDEANPQWFGFRGGKHILIRSLHVGDRFFARNWPQPERTTFLDWAQAQGYNTLSIASHYLNRDAEGRGKGWETPALWPLDASEYRRMEKILDELRRRRIIVFPFAGFLGRASNFPKDSIAQEQFIRYALARIGADWNVMLNVGGPEPELKGNSYLTVDQVNGVGELIRKLDVFGHLLSCHTQTGDSPYVNQDWASYVVMQGPKTLDLRELSAGMLKNHHPRKPLYAQETLWSGNEFHRKRFGRDYSDDELRKNAIVLTMSAAAINFADNKGDSSTGFSGTLQPNERAQPRHDIIKRVWDFFETVAFYRLTPRQDLVTNGYCLAEEGKEYLVYLDTQGTVDVKVTPGAYSVEWINARNTTEKRPAGTTTTGQNLSSPTDGDDWFVRLARPSHASQALFYQDK